MTHVIHRLWTPIGTPIAILTLDARFLEGTFKGHFPGQEDLVAFLVSDEGELFRGDQCQWGIEKDTLDEGVLAISPLMGLQVEVRLDCPGVYSDDPSYDIVDALERLKRFRDEGRRIFEERFQPGMPVRNFADKYRPTSTR